MISANACCHFAFWDAERKQQDASNGQAPFRRRSTTVTSTGPDGTDCDGSGSDHGCHFHNLLSGSQLFSAGFLAGVMAYRSAQLLIHSATLYRRDCLNHPQGADSRFAGSVKGFCTWLIDLSLSVLPSLEKSFSLDPYR